MQMIERPLENAGFNPESNHQLTTLFGGPVEKIPSELISEILLSAFYSLSASDEQLCFPFTPQQVCRRWYNAAVSTPQLWTLVHVRGPPFHNVKRRLQRSGGLLLDIEIAITESSSLGEQLGVIIPYVARWQRLVIRGETAPPDFHRAMESIPKILPNLLEFRIILQDNDISQPLPLLSSAPQLQVLHLTFCKPTWHQLTFAGLAMLILHDDVEITNVDSFIAVLRASPGLRRLELSGFYLPRLSEDSVANIRKQRMRFDKLESLRLENFFLFELMCFTSLIDGPQLKELVIGTYQNLPVHREFLPRHWEEDDIRFPQLEVLELDGLNVGRHDFEHIILSLPSVRHIRFIDDNSYTDCLLETIARRPQNLPPLFGPNLRQLTTRGVSTRVVANLVANLRLSLDRVEVFYEDATKPLGASKEEYEQLERAMDDLRSLTNVIVFGSERKVDMRFETWRQKEEWMVSQGLIPLRSSSTIAPRGQ
ncbi:hypothetical protein FRC02_001060 [Tulasnella sp. 418]|nr:hypothetical protein FRC02_001060 [Tulasnella sp. 418]